MTADAEALFYCATKINRYNQTGQIGSGTGFYYQVDLKDDGFIPLLVTNRHVISNCSHIVVNIHMTDDPNNHESLGSVKNCRIPINENLVINHPDPDVDLCAIFILDEIVSQFQGEGFPYSVCIRKNDIPTEMEWRNFDAIEDVIMIGCPNGLYDSANEIPIARRGITATPLSKDYNGKKEFMVDLACFPGSSGSPVIFRRDSSIRGSFSRQSQYLIGILYSGPTINRSGQIELGKVVEFNVRDMMHLGHVIKSSELINLERAFRFKFDLLNR
jgi:hypothetical protein